MSNAITQPKKQPFFILLAALLALLTATPSMGADGKGAYNTGIGLSVTGAGLFMVGTAIRNKGYAGHIMTSMAPAFSSPGSLLIVRGARNQGATVPSTLGWTSLGLWGAGEFLMVNAALKDSWGLALAGYATMGLSTILGLVQAYTATRALERHRGVAKRKIQFKKRRKMTLTPYSTKSQRGLALMGQF